MNIPSPRTTIKHNKLKTKLNLWNTDGFPQFIEDLSQYMGPEISIHIQVNALKNLYIDAIREIEKKSKFKQTKLF